MRERESKGSDLFEGRLNKTVSIFGRIYANWFVAFTRTSLQRSRHRYVMHVCDGRTFLRRELYTPDKHACARRDSKSASGQNSLPANVDIECGSAIRNSRNQPAFGTLQTCLILEKPELMNLVGPKSNGERFWLFVQEVKAIDGAKAGSFWD